MSSTEIVNYQNSGLNCSDSDCRNKSKFNLQIQNCVGNLIKNSNSLVLREISQVLQGQMITLEKKSNH